MIKCPGIILFTFFIIQIDYVGTKCEKSCSVWVVKCYIHGNRFSGVEILSLVLSAVSNSEIFSLEYLLLYTRMYRCEVKLKRSQTNYYLAYVSFNYEGFNNKKWRNSLTSTHKLHLREALLLLVIRHTRRPHFLKTTKIPHLVNGEAPQ
jgi:hypothetical protein